LRQLEGMTDGLHLRVGGARAAAENTSCPGQHWASAHVALLAPAALAVLADHLLRRPLLVRTELPRNVADIHHSLRWQREVLVAGP